MLTRESVLKETSIKNYNGFDFEELSNIPKINLRGNSVDKDFIYNIEKILNILLPIEPNTSNYNHKLKIIWLSPNEWLVEIYDTNEFDIILNKLQNKLNTHNTAVTDVTENRTILRLTGVNLYKLLSKFMIIDLDKALSKELSVAQTTFIKVPVLIVKNKNKDSNKSVNLHINRSHAQYINDLLIDGSKNLDF